MRKCGNRNYVLDERELLAPAAHVQRSGSGCTARHHLTGSRLLKRPEDPIIAVHGVGDERE